MKIVVIGGAPGSGKTSLARLLSSKDAYGVHIESDAFFRFLSHRIDPSTPEAQEQNAMVIRACLAAATEYMVGGYDIYLDGVIGPWLLPSITSSFPRFDYVLLRAPLKEVLARTASRMTQLSANPGVVHRMRQSFSDVIGSFHGHVIETSGKDLMKIADEFLVRSANGEFAYERA